MFSRPTIADIASTHGRWDHVPTYVFPDIEKFSDSLHLVVITRQEERSLHYKSSLHFTSCRLQYTPILPDG